MRKSDLKPGMVVEKRDGSRNLVTDIYYGDEIRWLSLNGVTYINSKHYNEELLVFNPLCGSFENLTVVKVYEDYTCTKVLWERRERPVLTEDEKTILKNIDPMFTHIARDNSLTYGLFIYHTKPTKLNPRCWGANGNTYKSLCMYNHMFDFITAKDEQPYSIKYLLGESETNE